MKPKIFFTLLTSLAFLFVFQQSANAEKYPFRNYSVDDGLPNPIVTTIFQDRDGYMWFGTDGGGVSRFDGRTFTSYSKSDGLVSNSITSIFQDKGGNLLFLGGGVSKFDGQNWTILPEIPDAAHGLEDSKGRLWFEAWFVGITMLEGDSLRLFDLEELRGGPRATSFIEDRNGNIWVGIWNEALKYDGAEWTNYKTGAISIFEDSRGNIWFGGVGDVSKFDGTNWSAYTLPAGFEDFAVGSTCEDREGNLWFGQYHPGWYGLREKGVVKFDGANWVNYTTENALAHNQVISLFTDREGNVWLGTNGRGVCKFGGARFTTYTTDDGLAANKVGGIRGVEGIGFCSGIFEDSKGNIWCLTVKGISRFDGKNWLTYNTENVLKSNRISSVCEDRKGNIWFGAAGWVYRFDGRRFTSYPKKETGVYNEIESILEDHEGNLWFGSNQHGVSRFDGKNWNNFLEQGKIPGDHATVIFKDSKGNLWFGNWDWRPSLKYGVTRYDGKNWITFNPDGIGLYDEYNGFIFYSQDSIIKYKYDGQDLTRYAVEEISLQDAEIENYLAGDRFAGKFVNAILEDRQGNVWFVTWDGGISKYDGENWTTYNTEDGLTDNNVECIFEDSEGNLWFGTYGNGVSRFDGQEFTNYTTANGLSSNSCYYIFQDGVYLYIGTNTGLNRFDGENFRVITARDGLAASELTNSYLEDSKDNLWFATEDGVTKYNPALEKPNQVLPPVYITGVSLFGKDISGQEYSRFSYKENNLRFDYIGICLTSPEDVVYRYKLEGLDSDWIVTDVAFASYPYLPPGEYAFKVMACNNDGLWNEQPAAISFVILPPFWATIWFRGLILAIILIIPGGVYVVRTRNMKRRNIELEEKVRERTLRINGILQSVADGLIVTDKLHNVSLMNKAAQDLLGVRLSEVIDRPIDFAIEEQTLRDRIRSTLENKPDGYQFDFELPAKDPDHPRIMRARTSMIRDERGEQIGIVTIIQDVTQEREVDRMKTEFLSTAAHELRTPLTSIQGFSEILTTREDTSPEEQKKFLGYINTQAVGLAHIINDLLDVSRIESGVGFSLDMVRCDIGELIRGIVPYFQEQSSKHQFEVIFPEQPVELSVDKDKMGQVLKNILSNAVKYSPDGGLIKISGEMAEDHFQVAVEDQGIGMTPEQVDRVFEKFYRVDASNTAVEGTGLGMTIIEYLVEAHGGEVFVESEYGKGTKVRFTIPSPK